MQKFEFSDFGKQCGQVLPDDFCAALAGAYDKAWAAKNSNISKWDAAILGLENYPKSDLKCRDYELCIDADFADYYLLEQHLREFMPWRKGAFKIGDLMLDAEWCSNLKWMRVLPHIESLAGKKVLDVGAGNGYFSLQMALAGAKFVLGVEPFLLFNYQFLAIKSLISTPLATFLLPLRLEQMPDFAGFDTVFSMGVLYHQRDHIEHLTKLKNMLTTGGEMVLETLIIADDDGCLTPQNRYAKMRNVWQIPSIKVLKSWLKKVGFKQVKLVDVNQTTTNEQRPTSWLGKNPQSLQDFLDPKNPSLTIEGYPRPLRALLVCRAG